MRRSLLIKDVKVFFRDVTQWSQLLLLVALVVVYLYNFQVLDLDRIPYMSGFIKNFYAFLNLGLAGFVMATVAARFVFPARVGGRRSVLDYQDCADHLPRFPVVQILVGPFSSAAHEPDAHGRGQ